MKMTIFWDTVQCSLVIQCLPDYMMQHLRRCFLLNLVPVLKQNLGATDLKLMMMMMMMLMVVVMVVMMMMWKQE
jgi:hypothetical protein